MANRKILELSRNLSRKVDTLRFSAPVATVYNPLSYAKAPHEEYLNRFARKRTRVLLLGMNPGPWGMAQTGIPFGEVGMVKDWLGIRKPVGKPRREHPKRPILGFDCTRSEISGKRLWGWAARVFQTPEQFFQDYFIWNYCPLVFMEESGKNLTPDKLKAKESGKLFTYCDQALRELLQELQPELAIGIGKFAESRLKALQPSARVGTILHPSPASPAANRGWEPQATAQLRKLEAPLPG